MAVQVKRSSATLACLYTHFILLIILVVFNFTVLTNNLPVNTGYGIALILFAVIATILGITAQDSDDTLLRSLLLCVSVLWTGVGIYHVVEGVRPTGTTDEQALWVGYSSFLLLFLFFIFGSLYHRSKFTAVLSLGYFLACIFEISSLWRPLRASVGAYYLLMAALVLYMIVSIVLRKFRQGEPFLQGSATAYYLGESRDYLPLGHGMNTVAFAVMAGHVTGVYRSVADGYLWLLSGGSFQLLAAILAVRRSDVFNGFYFFLHSMFWLTSGYNYCVEFVTGVAAPPLIAVVVIFFVVFFIVAVATLFHEMYQFWQNLALCVLAVAIYVDGAQGPFLGAMGWILLVISLYGLAAHMSRVHNSGFKLPLGMRCLEGARIRRLVEAGCTCCLRCLYGAEKDSSSSSSSSSPSSGGRQPLFREDFILGYSKYRDLDAVGFAASAVTLLALLWIPQGLWVMPWALGFGGITLYAVGSVSFARGLTFESCSFFVFGSLWLIWGPARGLGVFVLDHGPAMVSGCVGLLCVGVLQLLLSLTVSLAWTALITLFILVVIGFLLTAIAHPSAFVYEIVMSILFVLVCLYCFVSSALRSAVGRELVPLGRPLLQVSFLHSQGTSALWADARRASGVKAIADIMNRGGICGIPTDVVYVLVAAVKFPQAVERAYNTKEAAEDRPMSMWISRTQQLTEGRPLFGELVWAFMNEVWPSTVSCVIPKGQWLENLGIGEANRRVGRPDSIAVRMPDNCVTSYLVDQTGPIAVTSANPTGEADTTHHLQVLAKLGLDNVDGILCSGPSPENMASTVVDTRRMAQGQLSFFRIGVVPRARVEAIFDYVRTRFNQNGPTLPPYVDSSVSSEGEVNEAYVNDDDTSDSGVSGGQGGGSLEDAISLTHQPLTSSLPASHAHLHHTTRLSLHAQSQISGHQNPIYDDSTDTGHLNHGDLASFSGSLVSVVVEDEHGRRSPAVSVIGRGHLYPSAAAQAGPEEDGPYEAMTVGGASAGSGALRLQQIGKGDGKLQQQLQQQQQQEREMRFAVNPLFVETQQI